MRAAALPHDSNSRRARPGRSFRRHRRPVPPPRYRTPMPLPLLMPFPSPTPSRRAPSLPPASHLFSSVARELDVHAIAAVVEAAVPTARPPVSPYSPEAPDPSSPPGLSSYPSSPQSFPEQARSSGRC